MSETSTNLPLWIQDRDTVIANGSNVEWRYQTPPDYSRTNQNLQRESQHNHLQGSLEAIVQNLVRTFEMEASYKSNPQQWISIVTDKFRMMTNGGTAYTADDVADAGTYNLFLGDSDKYKSSEEDFESSAHIFHQTFPNGFLWELIEVLSGPPTVTFKWRHWGEFSGPYKEHAPTGDTVEVVGVSIARVNDDLKIETLEHFFDNSSFLNKLTTGCPFHT
ncbi:SnoaL-like polyketide cyclase [Anabaena sp. UHCC 0399]|uniref:SnoaL-like polyketide cyclase n=1 Tax=Anabaena sp. UHCC 0399 TaxID=3110238 RepID=UPI002B1F8DD1|nr:SnoaL-like polyketide cyclase [Anabaena sp. UHCC 0399]MEA5568733.1 SnoaL-like polyketide cyclase [Anabaena sp. UHCC 0399]